MTSLKLRSYLDDDRHGVRSFLARAIGSTTNFDRYETENPIGPPIRVIAEQGGRIVGFNQWNAWLVRAARRDIVAYQSGTSAVDPASRGQGVFARLLGEGTRQAEQAGVTAFIGFPNPLSVGSLVRDGWVHVKDLLLYVSLMPSFARRPPFGAVEAEGVATPPFAFARWRYRDAGISSVRVGNRIVLFVTERRARIQTIRLLDVLRDDGARDHSNLSAIVRALPGPAIAYCRSSVQLSSVMINVPRRWNTPLLVKRIHADDATLQSIHEATFVYGDIDAA